MNRVASVLRAVWRSVTPAGRAVIGSGIVAWIVGGMLGWEEFGVAASVCVVTIGGALLFTLGKSLHRADLVVHPRRVTVGELAGVQLNVSNPTAHRLLPGRFEIEMGDARAECAVASLGVGDTHEELFSLPTVRRAVIPIGPVVAVRGDPLGLCRVERVLSGIEELFVHPQTVPLERLGSGFLKDLEGQTTQDRSNSDVAFHTLREYVPGDDRRHVHWKTTARMGKMMVRQFVDTRRSFLAVLMSLRRSDYRTETEFELAVSMAASLGRRTIRDEQSLSVIAGRTPLPVTSEARLLDGFSRLTSSLKDGLGDAANELNRARSAPSVVALVTGSAASLVDVRSAAERIQSDARMIVMRADESADASTRQIAGLTVLTVPTLKDLGHVVWKAART